MQPLKLSTRTAEHSRAEQSTAKGAAGTMELLARPSLTWPSWRTTFMPPLRFGIYECERRRCPCGYPQTRQSRQRWWCRWCWWRGKGRVLDKCLRMGSPCGRRSFAVAASGRGGEGGKLELGRVPGSFCLKLFAILINVHALRTAGQFGVTGAECGGE